jgi:hypothetical protein
VFRVFSGQKNLFLNEAKSFAFSTSFAVLTLALSRLSPHFNFGVSFNRPKIPACNLPHWGKSFVWFDEERLFLNPIGYFSWLVAFLRALNLIAINTLNFSLSKSCGFVRFANSRILLFLHYLGISNFPTSKKLPSDFGWY